MQVFLRHIPTHPSHVFGSIPFFVQCVPLIASSSIKKEKPGGNALVSVIYAMYMQCIGIGCQLLINQYFYPNQIIARESIGI